ncbi:hypothetical protein Ciccas_008998 [Cichlidogyrus casuarinus]|uniref:Tex-like protein N-terminal domain-containing protein n=1 Tax=Cichlidogyrus casuarinus TaxID=1844966 RepID=A0ABD2PYB4_9PLAT
MANDSDCQIISVEWGLNEEISSNLNVAPSIAQRVIDLLDQGNTVPFISRYRKEVTQGLQPEVIHAIKNRTDQLRAVIRKVQISISKLQLSGSKETQVKTELAKCKTVQEVDMVLEPYKPAAPKTLSGRAIEAGLDPIATAILLGTSINFANSCDIPQSAREVYESPHNVEDAVMHIISQRISKDINVNRAAEAACDLHPPWIITKKRNSVKMTEMNEAMRNSYETDLKKFDQYLEYRRSVDRILPHNVLAINRAENREIIRVSVEFNPIIRTKTMSLIENNFISKVHNSHRRLLDYASHEAWDKYIQTRLSRSIRLVTDR